MRTFLVLALTVLMQVPASGGQRSNTLAAPPWPELLLAGGRKLTYQQTLTSERDVHGKQRFWSKLFNIVLGEPDFRQMVRPYGVAVDSRGRIIVTDPDLAAIHVFDPAHNSYQLIDRWDKDKDPMIEPQCVAIDEKDNIYVTDPKSGKVFVFDSGGKMRKVFGSLKGGEGFFKRPTGIAINRERHEVYVTDTLRDRVFVLDMDGNVQRTFGQNGGGDGEFHFPTEVHIKGDLVAVVDTMNFRVQLFDQSGRYKGSIGTSGDPTRGIYRPKGLAIDSEDHIYLVEGESGMVEVYDLQGQLLYYFGNGSGFGDFLLPAGLFIDRSDRVYLVDSLNRRVQIFQYRGLKQVQSNGVTH